MPCDASCVRSDTLSSAQLATPKFVSIIVAYFEASDECVAVAEELLAKCDGFLWWRVGIRY